MAWWVRIRVVAVAISYWLYAFILTAAPAHDSDDMSRPPTGTALNAGRTG